jgi:hypothetical protein
LPSSSDAFVAWLASLETKHLRELTFREVSRSLRALSATYVERRHRLVEGAALSGRGKRAAFALFYGPLHHLLVAHIVRALPSALDVCRRSSISDAAPARQAPRGPRR